MRMVKAKKALTVTFPDPFGSHEIEVEYKQFDSVEEASNELKGDGNLLAFINKAWKGGSLQSGRAVGPNYKVPEGNYDKDAEVNKKAIPKVVKAVAEYSPNTGDGITGKEAKTMVQELASLTGGEEDYKARVQWILAGNSLTTFQAA